MKNYLKGFLTVAAICVCAAVFQFAFAANTITWTNPTTKTDGTPFTTQCCTNIWFANNSLGTGSTWLAQVKGLATSYTDPSSATGTYCYALQTIDSVSGAPASALTGWFCKTVGAAPPPTTSIAAPNFPTNVKVI